MNFRLITLLYAFALLSAALAVFGGWGGGLSTVGVLLLWVSFRSGDWAAGCGLASVACILLLAALLIQPVVIAREAARANSCLGSLTQLSLSLLNYESANGTFPPAAASLGTSGDKQSWRLVIIPQFFSTNIYNGYNFNEPWNGPTNSKLPTCYFYYCPSHGFDGASYLAVVGPRCVWNDGPPRKLADITDNHSQTILLIDVGRSDIDWKEPRDLSFDEAIELLTAPVDPQTFTGHFYEYGLGMSRKPSCFYNVAMVDGSVHRIHVPLDRSTAEALLTANGGETIDDALLGKLGQPGLRYDRIYGSILFAVLAIAPVVPAARRRIWPSENSNEEQHQELEEILEH